MKKYLLILGLSAAFLPNLPAQNAATDQNSPISKASSSIQADLNKALSELSALRDGIAKEKPPIAIEAEKIAADLRDKRRKADLARTSREGAEADAEKAEKEIKVWRDEKGYIESLLADFQRTIRLSESFDPLDPSGETPPADAMDDAATLVGKLAPAAIHSQAGHSITEDGTVIEGTFVNVGPTRLFLSSDKKQAGLIGEGPDLQPRMVRPESPQTVESLLDGKASDITIDPSMGLALELEKTQDSLLEHTKKGGFWIYPIILLAVVSLLCAILKWLQLKRIRTVTASTVQTIINAVNANKSASALAEASRLRHPSQKILTQGVQFLEENPGATRSDLEEALYEKYLEAGPALQRWLPPIAIAAATAPLLGLLGTVTGMMETFRLITVFGSGDAKQLASGIAEALITTEYGLIVAIPSLIFHALLSRKVQGIKASMEMTSLAFLNGVKTDESDGSVSAGA